MNTVPLVPIEGDAFERGYRHGAARAAHLRAFLDDGLARLNHVMDTPVTLDALRPRLSGYRTAIAAAVPALAEEIRGLAAGARLDPDEALLLQTRREVMGYRAVPARGDCTAYARTGTGDPVLAQTVDLNGNLDDQMAVLSVRGTRRALVLSFGGLLGYLGMNSDGLAVGLNLVLGGRWGPGLPPYLAIRHLLDTAGSVDEAVTVLRRLPLASSRSILLCDKGRVAFVEVLGPDTRVVEAPELVHTNHFLHPDFAPRDELNVFARNSSHRRIDAATTALGALPPDAGAAHHFAVLSAPPICVPDEGDIRRERTVAAVVMRPAHGELHVRPGDPSRSANHVFTLD